MHVPVPHDRRPPEYYLWYPQGRLAEMGVWQRGCRLRGYGGLTEARYAGECQVPVRNDCDSLLVQRNSLPAWLWRLLTSLPIPRWRRFCAADEIVYKVRTLLGGTAQKMLMRWSVRC